METWKPIECVNGAYEVSSNGGVKSVERLVVQSNGKRRVFPEKIKAPNENGTGYLAVNMFVNSRCVRRYIHRLVAEAFIENPTGLPQVNHKNGDKSDNSVKNLEWCSASENCRHAIAGKLYETARGEAAGNAKLSQEEVLEIRRLHGCGMMQKDIAELFPVNRRQISRIVNRKRWAHV